MTRDETRELFFAAWHDLHACLAGERDPGILIGAVDRLTGRVAGTAFLAAGVGAVRAAIVGGHPRCDIQLGGDPALCDRQLAVVLLPLRAGDRAPTFAYRVIDLRTRSAFADEDGRRLESVLSDGPAFLRLRRYVLFILVHDDATAPSTDASTAWSAIPDRIYLAERLAPRRAAPALDLAGYRPFATRVTVRSGPRFAHTFDDDEALLGHLVLSRPGGRVAAQRVPVGTYASSCGLLLGRSDRCDAVASGPLTCAGLSRVHVLILGLDDRLVAIDVASTNGTFAGHHAADRRVRAAFLSDGGDLVLGKRLVRVQWEPAVECARAALSSA